MITSEQRYGRCWGKTPPQTNLQKTLINKNATKFKIVCPLGILPKSRTPIGGLLVFAPHPLRFSIICTYGRSCFLNVYLASLHESCFKFSFGFRLTAFSRKNTFLICDDFWLLFDIQTFSKNCYFSMLGVLLLHFSCSLLRLGLFGDQKWLSC